jgi:hypothetical protein
MKKRLLSAFMAVCMLFSLGVISGAVGENEFVFYYGDKEITVSGDFDVGKAQSIADALDGQVIIEPLGIVCVFLGHDLVSGVGKEITHRVYATAPRCFEKTYDITYCTRCNYSVGKLVRERYISCC